MTNTNNRNEHIKNLILKQISKEHFDSIDKVIGSLDILLNGNANKYNFNIKDIKNTEKNSKTIEIALSKFNELTVDRKTKGTYYTPQDLTNYITLNTIIMSILEDNNVTYKDYKAMDKIIAMEKDVLEEFLFDKTIFDPTCGSGEFLVNSAEIKLKILESTFGITDENVIKISRTIFGNDINHESVDIAMYRLFSALIRNIENDDNYLLLAKIIKNNFTHYDFVNYKKQIKNKFDIIVGNPPYVEYRKYEGERNKNITFGNVYADVVYNSISLIKKHGAFGYVLPLSYAATGRMKKLREIIIEKFNTQFVLSFADRPDCLFPGVHQKLNIVIGKKGKEEHKLYSSKYNIWRKDERNNLLNGCEIIKVYNGSPSYIPKIGNQIEESIFRKIRTVTEDNIYDKQNEKGSKIYLNMRAAFWIKSFSFNPGSREYKEFSYDKNKKNFILSLLNSSLYWMFWTIVSDGWHITNKELKEFFIPDKEINYNKFDTLTEKLENCLEETKKYIGSKQTEYEYKHKKCKHIIDQIDDELANIYDLTNEELEYVKNFSVSYRMGEKND